MNSSTLSIIKYMKLCKKEPELFENDMERYFKGRPPDCSFYSEDNVEIQVHKEVLYQTSYLREMIKTGCTESKIEVLCTSLTLQELEIVKQFLYKGEIFLKIFTP